VRLGQADLEGIVRFVAEAGDVRADEPFPSDVLGGLRRRTPREDEILQLVAEGRTNAEIAETLWLAPGTVRRHLESVFAKLGVHTRTAAAAFALPRAARSERTGST
jgi:DNA-binding NarL/FixJ family response regulator